MWSILWCFVSWRNLPNFQLVGSEAESFVCQDIWDHWDHWANDSKRSDLSWVISPPLSFSLRSRLSQPSLYRAPVKMLNGHFLGHWSCWSPAPVGRQQWEWSLGSTKHWLYTLSLQSQLNKTFGYVVYESGVWRYQWRSFPSFSHLLLML